MNIQYVTQDTFYYSIGIRVKGVEGSLEFAMLTQELNTKGFTKTKNPKSDLENDWVQFFCRGSSIEPGVNSIRGAEKFIDDSLPILKRYCDTVTRELFDYDNDETIEFKVVFTYTVFVKGINKEAALDEAEAAFVSDFGFSNPRSCFKNQITAERNEKEL